MRSVCASIVLGLLFAPLPTMAATDGPAIATHPDAAARLSAFRLPAAYGRTVDAALPASLDPGIRIAGLSSGVFHGFPSWLVQTPLATVAISVSGGQLLSFVPTGGREVLWLSPQSDKPPLPVRGGTPVCWPYFARMGQAGGMPSHGLVRTARWSVTQARRESDGTLVLKLAPPVLAGLPLRLTMTLRIGRTLSQTLETENVGDQPVVFTQALHNYFRVSDVRKVTVSGLDGLTYLDKKDHGRAQRQQGDWQWPSSGYSDRIYTGATGPYVLHDPGLGRNIRITTRGSHSAVVWNAGEQAARGIDDIGAGWRHYLSVEVTNVAPDAITLQPGERHELEQVIEVVER
ncbi:D-hexose-6-phosphate mutarotase [Rhodanobacter sp. FDAARGOS 1247]|nr:D-hexose-6-phosphate mutarotase [Rhodanobacter sp. FDAARGOS 1247]